MDSASFNQSKIQDPKSKIGTWLLAARPKTLWAAVAPVLVGTALALERGVLHVPSALAAALGAILIQIGTNFSNDYLDAKQGADTEERLGPLRVTQAGLVSEAAMRRATVLAFALAFVSGLYLVWRGGWPVLAIGVASILAGVAYTAGRYSLGYLGLGDLAVLVFFGPVAVGGTYYVQALDVDALVLLAGVAPGLLAVAILVVNNLRDVEQDRQAEKKTLVVRFGRHFGLGLYAFCLLGAAATAASLAAATEGHWGALIALLVLAPGWSAFRDLRRTREPARLNPLLGRTAKLLLLYSVLFAVGWNL